MDEKNNWTNGLENPYVVAHREVNEILENFIKEIYKGALEGFDMKKIKLGDKFIMLSVYDTEEDERKAERDIKRALSILSTYGLAEIISVLTPYRKREAQKAQQVADEAEGAVACIEWLIKESACDLCGHCAKYIPPKKNEDFTPCPGFEKYGKKACLDGVIDYFIAQSKNQA